MATFLHRLRRAVKTRFFDSTDFNGQESGVYTGPALADWKVGDQITISAEPHSRRECLDGTILINVVGVIDVPVYDDGWPKNLVEPCFKISLEDNMGRIGGYPDYETHQSPEGDLSGDWFVSSINGELLESPEYVDYCWHMRRGYRIPGNPQLT